MEKKNDTINRRANYRIKKELTKIELIEGTVPKQYLVWPTTHKNGYKIKKIKMQRI